MRGEFSSTETILVQALVQFADSIFEDRIVITHCFILLTRLSNVVDICYLRERASFQTNVVIFVAYVP